MSQRKKNKKYNGVVTKEFKIRKDVFAIADKFTTVCEITYNHLINTKRIK